MTIEVTVRHLLEHRSGIPNHTDSQLLTHDLLADLSRHVTSDEVLAYVDWAAASIPGRRFASSDTNDILPGQLLEHVDGTGLDESPQRRITAPLGLHTTRFDRRRDGRRRRRLGGRHPRR